MAPEAQSGDAFAIPDLWKVSSLASFDQPWAVDSASLDLERLGDCFSRKPGADSNADFILS